MARRLLVYLRVDGLQSLSTIITLLGNAERITEQPNETEQLPPEPANIGTIYSKSAKAMPSAVSLGPRHCRAVEVHALRLVELTERNSSVMRVSELESYTNRDPIIRVFGNLAKARDISIGGQISVVPQTSYASALVDRTYEVEADLVVVPWSETGNMSEFPDMFGQDHRKDPFANSEYLDFVSAVFDRAAYSAPVGIWMGKELLRNTLDDDDDLLAIPQVNAQQQLHSRLTRVSTGHSITSIPGMHRGIVSMTDKTSSYCLFVFFSGSTDDLYAVRLSIQLARNKLVHSVHIFDTSKTAQDQSSDLASHTIVETLENVKLGLLGTPVHDKIKITSTRRSEVQNLTQTLDHSFSEDTEAVVMVGRNLRNQAVAFRQEEDKALGLQASAIIRSIRYRSYKELVAPVSVLVVQAKASRDEDGARMGRKRCTWIHYSGLKTNRPYLSGLLLRPFLIGRANLGVKPETNAFQPIKITSLRFKISALAVKSCQPCRQGARGEDLSKLLMVSDSRLVFEHAGLLDMVLCVMKPTRCMSMSHEPGRSWSGPEWSPQLDCNGAQTWTSAK